QQPRFEHGASTQESPPGEQSNVDDAGKDPHQDQSTTNDQKVPDDCRCVKSVVRRFHDCATGSDRAQPPTGRADAGLHTWGLQEMLEASIVGGCSAFAASCGSLAVLT